MRIKHLGVLAVVVALAACSGKDEAKVEAGAEATTGVEATPAADTASAVSTGLVVADTTVPYEGRVISDQELKGSSGKVRRQVEIVFSNVEREQLLAAVNGSLTSAGFTAGRTKDVDGDLTVNFKKGEETIGVALAQPKRKEAAEIAGASVKATFSRRL